MAKPGILRYWATQNTLVVLVFGYEAVLVTYRHNMANVNQMNLILLEVAGS